MLDKLTSWLLSVFLNIWEGITYLVKNIVLTVFDMQKDIFFWVIDTLLEFAIPLLDAVGNSFTQTFNPATYINNLPADVLNIMGLIGLGEATAIIISAILVRLLLQLIPFVRLGS